MNTKDLDMTLIMDKPCVFLVTRKLQHIKERPYIMQNEAIKLAIEKGGYHESYQTIGRIEEQIILDPLFWQALGKVTGWDSQTTESENFKFNGSNIIPDWLHIALYYNYLRLTGGDTEKFWLDLLNPKRNL